VNTTGMLARTRALHRSVMVDSCTVTRVTQGILDELTGVYAVSMATVYTGPCRVKPAQTSTVDAAGIAVDTTRPTLDLPWTAGSFLLLPGDRVTVDTGPLLGFGFEVYAEEAGTTSTSRRYTLEQKVTPGGVPS
jgi:hypothetical protein